MMASFSPFPSLAIVRLLIISLVISPPVFSYNAIIVGGSSGMGKAAAQAILEASSAQDDECCHIMLVSRSKTKLEQVQCLLLESFPRARISIHAMDASEEDQVKAFASDLLRDDESDWDGLVISCAGKAPHGPMQHLPTEKTKEMMESKVWTAYHCAKHISPILLKTKKISTCGRTSSAVVFVAGILNRRPGINCCPLAMANGALEGMTRSLALEWGPAIRVNCLSPGFCDTERFDHMSPERKAQMLQNTAESLPLGRVGQPKDMGQAIHYLLTAEFCTGVILDVDGGHGIRQYAKASTDPMRQNTAS